MRTYISGKISGLPYEEVEAKFQEAEDLLMMLDMEAVNPLKNGLKRDSSWENHMVRDIEILLTCDAILLLEDWLASKGARIEKNLAEEAGLMIFFESNITDSNKQLQKIKDAIQNVTGLRFEEYTTASRERNTFFARMIIINYCRLKEKMSLPEIARLVHRDHTTVMHCLKTYKDEVKYNFTFREIVRKVDNILSKSVSE